MKHISYKLSKAFTLVELLVVMTVIGVMMTLASSVLRDSGTGRTLDSGVDLLRNLVQEARATAQGNDTYTRLVIATDPNDTSRDSRHLRFMVVQILRKDNSNYDGSSVDIRGDWVSTSAGVMLPPGVYFSPSYSHALSWAEGGGDRIGTDTARVSKNKTAKVYYFEFDEKGRFVSPATTPLSPSQPHRLVLINARPGKGRNSKDGIIPMQMDSRHLPTGAKGIVLWPSGYTSLLRTREQIFNR